MRIWIGIFGHRLLLTPKSFSAYEDLKVNYVRYCCRWVQRDE